MTENKRYDVIYEKEPRGQVVTDNGIPCTARTCCTRLNWLEEENKELKEENEQLKQQLKDKEVEWLRNDTVWEQMPSNNRTTTKTSRGDVE